MAVARLHRAEAAADGRRAAGDAGGNLGRVPGREIVGGPERIDARCDACCQTKTGPKDVAAQRRLLAALAPPADDQPQTIALTIALAHFDSLTPQKGQ